MDQSSRDSVDAAELSAQLDVIADQIDTGVQYQRAFAPVVLDELNALRAEHGLADRTAVSTGFSSGHFGGRAIMVMFGGTTMRIDMCQPA